MPWLDGTGPGGLGPGMGRGLGPCGVGSKGVGRPRIGRRLRFKPGVMFFKPAGVPMVELEEVELRKDEVEALKLHDVDGLEQTEAARKMKVSQPTLARTLDQAYKKIAKALIEGKAIRIASE